MASDRTALCVIGDLHGHLQLGLCVAARWQQLLGVEFEAVLLCGDVGSFTHDSQLDSTTRRHGKDNPCELEFLTQWSVTPQPAWLQGIFQPRDSASLGLLCPVVMVHGNHEGFAHLARLIAGLDIPADPVALPELPIVDTGGHLRYLPSGWKLIAPKSGKIVAGIGGIEEGQRYARYHPLAYLDETPILHLLDGPNFDVLITHQGPSGVQGNHGSPLLQNLLDAGLARFWFHGHSTPHKTITAAGPNGVTTLVPLEDIAFPGKGPNADDPGEDGWACLFAEGTILRERPAFWREYRRRRWLQLTDGRLVCPDLVGWVG